MKAISKKSALNRMDWFDFLNYFIMLLVIVCTVFPLYYCAIVSISNGAAVTKGEVVFAPVGFDTTAYKVVFGNSQILRSYGNTIYYTLLGTAINIALTVLCAYPLSRPTLKGRKALNFLFMLTMFINGGMIPMYLQVKSLGMLDTVWSIVLPGAISTYNMIIMRSFFSSIPEAIIFKRCSGLYCLCPRRFWQPLCCSTPWGTGTATCLHCCIYLTQRRCPCRW